MSAAEEIERVREVRRHKPVNEDGWSGMRVRHDGQYVRHSDHIVLAEAAQRDIAILIEQISWLETCFGESLEAEEAALVKQIREEWAV